MSPTQDEIASPPSTVEQVKPVTVLITGFGPFHKDYPRNPSWEIASSLPPLLPATHRYPTPIQVYVHPAPIDVAFTPVADVASRLHSSSNPKPDIILHLGLAAGRTFYTLEQGAYSRGYDAYPDVDGKRLPDSAAEQLFSSKLYPRKLETSFDTDDVMLRWRHNLRLAAQGFAAPLADVRMSPDAGNFLCGFIYYNSLARYFEEGSEERPVAFMHVPYLTKEKAVEDGKQVAIALLRALVESRREVGLIKRGEVAEEESEKEGVAQKDANFA